MHTDASKAQELFDMISGLCQLPVNFFLTVAILLYYFGVSFLVSLIVFGISFLINKRLARNRKVLQKERLKLGDTKSNDINEILSNAKMLKLYGW
jgi:ABC transporter transmembrane region